MKKSFFASLTKPRIEYAPFTKKLLEPVSMPMPSKATLLLNDSIDTNNSVLIKAGDTVKTGQKLALFEDSDAYIISSVSGTVTSLAPHAGDFGWSGTAISIDVSEKEELDDQIKHLGLKLKKPVSENNPVVEGVFFNFRVQVTLGMGETHSKFLIKRLP